MRTTALCVLTFCLALLVPLLALADEFPERKAGLWEIKMAMAGINMDQTMKQCVDADTDAKMMQMAKGNQGKMNCSKNEFRKEGASYVAESECATAAMKMVTKTVFSGDFQKKYIGETVTKFDPPVAGMSEQKMTLTASWVGPCEAGQKPGDIVMPGGIKMNVGSM